MLGKSISVVNPQPYLKIPDTIEVAHKNPSKNSQNKNVRKEVPNILPIIQSITNLSNRKLKGAREHHISLNIFSEWT